MIKGEHTYEHTYLHTGQTLHLLQNFIVGGDNEWAKFKIFDAGGQLDTCIHIGLQEGF